MAELRNALQTIQIHVLYTADPPRFCSIRMSVRPKKRLLLARLLALPPPSALSLRLSFQQQQQQLPIVMCEDSESDSAWCMLIRDVRELWFRGTVQTMAAANQSPVKLHSRLSVPSPHCLYQLLACTLTLALVSQILTSLGSTFTTLLYTTQHSLVQSIPSSDS